MLISLCTKCAHGRSSLQFALENADFVFAFFSSVSYHLEGVGNWGKRFPRLLSDLCDHGLVELEHFDELSRELHTIRRELQRYSIMDAVYDIADLSKPIPFELLPGCETHDLARPWVTIRSARSFFEVFEDAMTWAKEEHCPLVLIFPMEQLRKETLWIKKQKGRDYWLQYENSDDT